MRRLEHNPAAPHQAVITVNIDIMEQLHSGQVSGLPIKKFAKVYTVLGKNQQECEENLAKFMEKFSTNKTEDIQNNSYTDGD
jgi:hypothetical protein